MNELVHIRLDPKMRKAMKKVVESHYYRNESELIRDAIRSKLDKYERLELLKSVRGKAKLRKYPPKDTPSDIFREFGLENIPEVGDVPGDDK